MINENEPFREWTENRLMPYIDYFSVPLDGKNTGILCFIKFQTQFNQKEVFRDFRQILV